MASKLSDLRIGDLVKLSGKTARTLHFYEELGLLRPTGRTQGGFRLYDETALLRIRWIERLQELGFGLTEIQDFLGRLVEHQYGPEANRQLEVFYEEKLRETEATIARLQRLRTDLSASIEYLQGCRSCDPLTHRATCASCAAPAHEGTPAPDMVAAVHSH